MEHQVQIEIYSQHVCPNRAGSDVIVVEAHCVLQSSQGLHPSAVGTTVRVVEGKTQVLDGPYADSKEQLGGFHIIGVPHLDAALSWAARSPTALHGVVEVRPIMEKQLSEIRAELADRSA